MRRRTRDRSAERLRRVVARMPEASRRAMLESVRSDEIIVGAYTGRDGGVCPMLGAHRRGGRCDLAEFARAWDRYTEARDGKPRPASDRERQVLTAMLEQSLALDPGPTELGRVVSEVKAARRRRAGDAARRLGLDWLRTPAAGDPDLHPTPEPDAARAGLAAPRG